MFRGAAAAGVWVCQQVSSQSPAAGGARRTVGRTGGGDGEYRSRRRRRVQTEGSCSPRRRHLTLQPRRRAAMRQRFSGPGFVNSRWSLSRITDRLEWSKGFGVVARSSGAAAVLLYEKPRGENLSEQSSALDVEFFPLLPR